MPANSALHQHSGFTPRKEFIREQRSTSNSFALLAIAGSSCIRLYSFPTPLVTDLRHLFEQRSILASFRQGEESHSSEFFLQGKPWASPKTISTEKLLVDILATIYQHDYSYLSTIDYGRDHDDRLAMAFSKPFSRHQSARPGSPRPSFQTPDGSPSLVSDKLALKRAPFALSFPSATLLRVIAPPLHSTPAILQAVRGSWPRGVVSEKRISDPPGSFEFKLKGYKWFQEDTFATDSLRHILSLLSSLDAHSFSLLTSISLSNRSRVKDLWIFTGPAASPTEDLALPDSPAPSILNSSPGHTKRADAQPHNKSPIPQGSQSQHRRAATAPATSPTASQPPLSPHARSATDNGSPRQIAHANQISTVPGAPPSPTSSQTFSRKPAPRAQVPVSVIHESDQEGQRANLASTIPSGVENMTGVGAPGYSPEVFYTASPFGVVDPSARSATPLAPVPVSATPTRSRSVTPPGHTRSLLRPVSTRVKTPPLLTSNTSPPSTPSHAPPGSPSQGHIFPSQRSRHVSEPSNVDNSPSLLGPGAFRDSAFSSTTTASCDVPIKWTGKDTQYGTGVEQDQRPSHPKAADRMPSPEPILPGGWQPTPVTEGVEEVGGAKGKEMLGRLVLKQDRSPERPLQDVGSLVESPELMQQDVKLRNSETGLVGLIASTTSLPPQALPSSQGPFPVLNSKGQDRSAPPSSGSGQGWVLVNVEGRKSPSLADVPASPVLKDGRKSESAKPTSATPSPPGPQASLSPAAKAVVVIDALENKDGITGGKPKSGKDHGGDGSTPSRMRKLLNLTRKTSKKVPGQEQGHDDDVERTKNKTRPRASSGGLRERIKRMGTTEAPRNEEKQRSFD